LARKSLQCRLGHAVVCDVELYGEAEATPVARANRYAAPNRCSLGVALLLGGHEIQGAAETRGVAGCKQVLRGGRIRSSRPTHSFRNRQVDADGMILRLRVAIPSAHCGGNRRKQGLDLIHRIFSRHLPHLKPSLVDPWGLKDLFASMLMDRRTNRSSALWRTAVLAAEIGPGLPDTSERRRALPGGHRTALVLHKDAIDPRDVCLRRAPHRRIPSVSARRHQILDLFSALPFSLPIEPITLRQRRFATRADAMELK